jgi:small-conductance mechanosensitive channel
MNFDWLDDLPDFTHRNKIIKKAPAKIPVFIFWLLAGFSLQPGMYLHAQAAKPQPQSPTPPPTAQSGASVPAQQQTGASPQPGSQGSAEERQREVVQHLNGVIRFYRDAEAPIQKVGEPSDLLYRDQAVSLASQVANFAFQSAKAEAAMTANLAAAADPQAQTSSQRLQATLAGVAERITTLKTQATDIETQLAKARAKDIPALQQQRQQIAGELELQLAMQEALGKITGVSGIAKESGFAAQIDQLERSAPGIAAGKPAAVAPTLENLSAARSAGVTSQARVLFDLLGARQDIENRIKEAAALHQQATDLRTPLIAQLRATIAQGETLSQQASGAAAAAGQAGPPAAPAPNSPKIDAAQAAAQLAATRKSFDALTATFKGISGAAVPLSQEIMTLEQSQAGLQAWHRAVDVEYTSILRSLLLRVLGIAIALGFIFGLGEVWRRATLRYVHDIRRRRQLLVVRRLAIGFTSGLVLIFGLVTQFSSLATFAGFITAGIAVGLQTILLSVAAYFFIIGRYGVKVGDRITIAGVTGDVAEVGLVRFYVMELAGNGTDLYHTGRVAVFSNAVLFQAATPLFKQMPGTDYLWHEMTVKLTPDSDYRPAVKAMLDSVQAVYEGYSKQIEQQHRQVEAWMDTSFDSPGVQSSLQLVDGGLQFWTRFPVLIRQSREIDDRMTQSLLKAISADPEVKAAVSAPPVIKAAVKG